MEQYPLISSVQNPKLKSVSALRDSRARRKSGSFLIDGKDLASKAIRAGVTLKQLYLSESFQDPEFESLVDGDQTEIYRLAPLAMDKIQYGERGLDVIAVAAVMDTSLGSLEQRIVKANRGYQSKTILVLDRMEKPGNLGAVLRTADAACVQAVILSDPICDVWNPNAVRSSLGGLFSVPIGIGSMVEVADWLKVHSFVIHTARVEGAVEYSAACFRDKHAFVIGNEAEGLADRWLNDAYQPLSIPMLGAIDSLNASVSTAILAFESLRQQRSE